ncbi:nuclear transport factor 2 family protein [Mycolicibacterium stellerae]|uniref:nuclear transport factor 2 family protein n=1 Tax=Mycolicibacterium stellerae TaxID=2358193 RepID=UPI000F0BA0B7|nr:nuclear transport factor 2 family protein [Mycolicibacterium stellerae]
MTRSATAKCAAAFALTAAPAAVLTVVPQATALADSCSDVASNSAMAIDTGACADVLAQERRWLTAITEGDRVTVDSILAPGFKHINSDGILLDRAQEIAGLEKVSFTMNPTDQLVDIAGDTAVIHGVNTLIDGGTVLARERFTDVFVLQNGTWMALSAQETAQG